MWGVHTANNIERVHTQYCKKTHFKCEKIYTNNLYGELGRYPLFVGRFCIGLKYLNLKILNMEHCILNTMK